MRDGIVAHRDGWALSGNSAISTESQLVWSEDVAMESPDKAPSPELSSQIDCIPQGSSCTVDAHLEQDTPPPAQIASFSIEEDVWPCSTK